MLPGESWWGLAAGFGRRMPFDAASDFKCDLRVSNYANAAASLLLSDKGRVIWCAEPVEATIGGGTIALVSDGGEIVLSEDAGGTLAEAFRFASRKYFPPAGGEPDISTSPRRSTTPGSSSRTTRTRRTSSPTRSRCSTTACRRACS